MKGSLADLQELLRGSLDDRLHGVDEEEVDQTDEPRETRQNARRRNRLSGKTRPYSYDLRNNYIYTLGLFQFIARQVPRVSGVPIMGL